MYYSAREQGMMVAQGWAEETNPDGFAGKASVVDVQKEK